MSFWLASSPLVLASGSRARRQILEAAGIPLDVRKVALDESALAARLIDAGADPAAIALALAAAKGEVAASVDPQRLVLAADQTLDLDGRLGMKPVDGKDARHQLLAMRGRQHHLHSALHLRRGEAVLWQGVERATLTMRDFSDTFLDHYLETMGPGVCSTVGGYELEALGAHLFERIEGDHETILGLPLRPLLAALRALGLVLA